MLNKYNVIISNQAEKELFDIINYINHVILEHDIAVKLLGKFRAMFASLEAFPEKFAMINDTYTCYSNARKCFVDNYVLIYKVNIEFKTVEIAHIFYARKNWMKEI